MRLLHSLLIAGASIVASVSPAAAHFNLMAPANFAVQDSDGNPQKTAPCGPAGSAFTPFDHVTEVQTGGTIDITVDETVTHPGHYRVSLAQSMADLPADPPVNSPSTCGSLDINPSPTLPLLADGLLVHTASFGGAPKTVTVQLPPGMTCTNCVLQVQEFMSQHGAPCFYHHCAMITIKDAPNTMPIDGGPSSTPDAAGPGGDAGTGSPASGGGCAAGTGAGIAIGLAGLGLRRRRRK